MRKLLFSMIVMVCAASFSFAQNTDYNKVDIYVGASLAGVDFGGSDREGFYGVEGAVTGNIKRYIGLKGDYAFHHRSFEAIPSDLNFNRHTLVGGVQFKDNSKEKKLKPFAHFMAGFTNARVSGLVSDSETGFAGVIGGGLDIRVTPRIDIRAIQFDYNPTRLGGATQHNFRIGVGLVFR